MFFSTGFFIFASFVVFITGLAVGSFLNVVIYRLPLNASIVSPPSSCPHCGKRIKFYDNIPLLSYLVLRGKCRNCGYKISVVYPMVELLTAALFFILFIKIFYGVFFYYNINISNFALFESYLIYHAYLFIGYSIFLFILISSAFIDLFNRIIPDSLNLILIGAGFAFNIFLFGKPFLYPFLGFALGGAFFYLIALLYSIFRKKEGLGGGDIKLIAGIGSFIGIKGVFFTIFGGSVLALLAFTAIKTLRSFPVISPEIFKASKHKTTSDVFEDGRIPFGPFLSSAAFLYLLYGNFMIRLYFSIIKK